MTGFLIVFIQLLANVLVIIVIAEVLLSYFLPPFHSIRIFLSRIIGPLLDPIRRILPNTGPIDFSPLVLLILVQILESILVNLLRGIG
jgi:YggT family protein